MSEKRDYYEILGVARAASKGEIDRAYRKLAIKYHPDSSSADDAVERFKEASEAYEILNDAEKRARYDRYGHAGVEGAAHQFNDVEDIFEAFSDIFSGGLFGDFFGGGRRRGRRARSGADIRAEATLDLEEAARGVNKTLEFSRHHRCETCNGSGAKPGSTPEPCRRCGGPNPSGSGLSSIGSALAGGARSSAGGPPAGDDQRGGSGGPGNWPRAPSIARRLVSRAKTSKRRRFITLRSRGDTAGYASAGSVRQRGRPAQSTGRRLIPNAKDRDNVASRFANIRSGS